MRVMTNDDRRRRDPRWLPWPLIAALAAALALANPSLPASPFASVASAQSPTPTPAPVVDPISQARAILVAPPTFRIGANTALDASGSYGDRLEWRITDGRTLFVADGRKLALTFTEPDAPNAAIPFAVELLAYTESVDAKGVRTLTSVDSTIVIVRPAGPVPPPPVVVVDPKPPTPPAPPGPVDPPAPPPVEPDGIPIVVSQAGLRVLIVEETDDASRKALNPGQRAIIQGTTKDSFRTWCKSHAEVVVADKDSSFAKLPAVWGELFNRPRAGLPWIVITNGKTGYEGFVPSDPAVAMKLVQSIGGIK